MRRLDTSKLSQTDKSQIKAFHYDLLVDGYSKFRTIKYLQVLRTIAEWKKTSYQTLDIDELKQIIISIRHDWDLAHDAQRDYHGGLRKFLQWQGKHDLAAIIKNPPKKRNPPPKVIPTIFDIVKMVESAQNLRDMVMCACFFESDTRPGEFFNLKWSDLEMKQIQAQKLDEQGCLKNTVIETIFLNVNGKTGPRRPFLIFTVPFLQAWQKAYPKGADGYIIIDLERNLEQIQHRTAMAAMQRLAKRAGLDPRIKLYSMRHGRNTEVAPIMTDNQQREFNGWTPDSNMPRVYNHLAGLNMMEPILSEFGIIMNTREEMRKAWIRLYNIGKRLLEK